MLSDTLQTSRPATGRRFDLRELLLISAALCLLTMVLTLRSFSALDAQRPFEELYGTKVSDGPEEWIVRDFFKDRRGGVFVDVGAAHYREKSNTYRLENTLGWSGVAIDAQAQYARDYRVHRPAPRLLPHSFPIGWVLSTSTSPTAIRVSPRRIAAT
jgi:hypothetical protein